MSWPRVLPPTYPRRVNIAKGCLMESIVIGTCNVRRFPPSLRPRYTQTKFAGTATFLDSDCSIVMPIFRGENSRKLIGIALIIVFGGYQLVANLPASHSASFTLLSPDGEGVCSSAALSPNRYVQFRADVRCHFGPCGFGVLVSAWFSVKMDMRNPRHAYIQGRSTPHERRSPAHADSRRDDSHRRVRVILVRYVRSYPGLVLSAFLPFPLLGYRWQRTPPPASSDPCLRAIMCVLASRKANVLSSRDSPLVSIPCACGPVILRATVTDLGGTGRFVQTPDPHFQPC